MDYRKLSDAEINAKVAICIWYTDMTVKSGEFDPCNNPADAWPIIVENRIRVNPFLYWMAEDYLSEEDISHQDENALRAAMIVFLMMQGDEQ